MLRELAEYPNSFIELTPGSERIETDRFTLCLSARNTTVQRQRFAAEELDAVIDEVRALLRERGRTRTQWEIGSQATPAGLADTLQARGFQRDDEPWALALVLTDPPPEHAPTPGLRVGLVETEADHIEARAVQDLAFGAPADAVEAGRERSREAFRRLDAARGGRPWSALSHLLHAVWADDRIVCAGIAERTRLGLALFGGATLPEFRGRGAYRALIGERWRVAVADQPQRPALATQSGAMSRPILASLGFRAVGRTEILVDDFA